MINKEAYMDKLREVLLKKFSSLSDARKKKQLVVEYKVSEEMLKYVIERYGSYYSDETIKLINEHQRLLKECLSDLGIKE